MGNVGVINALTTLSYDGRRSAYFRKELMAALKILDDGHIEHVDMKGSWAGAMGQPQFMPSSFLELAVDHDGDGKKDIWNNKNDVFASIANYLSKRGWDNSTTWGREVALPGNFDTSLIGKKVKKTLVEWQELGVRKSDGSNLPIRKDLQASIIKPEESKDKAYIIYSNYRTVLNWNRSLYFATAVGIVSDRIIMVD
jgi:membrane-bound lytic murein transglycosylase B